MINICTKKAKTFVYYHLFCLFVNHILRYYCNKFAKRWIIEQMVSISGPITLYICIFQLVNLDISMILNPSICNT